MLADRLLAGVCDGVRVERIGRFFLEFRRSRRFWRFWRFWLGKGGIEVGVELCEEPVGGGLPFPLAAPHDAATAVITDQREVAVSLSPRDLIDRDLKQIRQPVLSCEHLLADALDDSADRVPDDPGQPAGRGLVGLRRQPRDQVLEIAGEPGAVTGERDALHQRTVLGATEPPQPGVHLQAPAAEIQVPPDRVVMLLVLAIARGVRALRAIKAPTTQRDRHHDPAGLKADRPNPHPRQVKQAEECSADAHGRRPPVRRLRTREPTVRTRARRQPPARHPADSEESLLRPRNPRRSAPRSHLRSSPEPLKDLVASIRSWVTNWNDDPKPFVWHKTADAILDSLASYCQRISDSGH